MDLIAIPLIIIMALALIFYTITTFSSIIKKEISKLSLSFIHLSILLVIIGIFYMGGISSKLSYTYTSYSLMYMHQAIGTIAAVILIIHGIIFTILRRKNKRNSYYLKKGFNIFSFILWLICIIFYLGTFYIGVLSTIK